MQFCLIESKRFSRCHFHCLFSFITFTIFIKLLSSFAFNMPAPSISHQSTAARFCAHLKNSITAKTITRIAKAVQCPLSFFIHCSSSCDINHGIYYPLIKCLRGLQHLRLLFHNQMTNV